MKKFTMLVAVSMLFACGGDDDKNNSQTANNNSNNGSTVGPNNKSNNNTNNSKTTGQTINGACLEKNCQNPLAWCDGTIAVTFSTPASCDDTTGDCSNGMESRLDCAATGEACDNGVCVETCEADDVCEAPADVCSGAILTSYSGAGMCDLAIGACSYAAVTSATDCNSLEQVCQVDKCVDLCENGCLPPAGFCTGNTATSYSGNGMCAFLDGSCDYSNVETVTDCALANLTCSDGVCVGGTPIPPTPGDLVFTEILPDSDAVDDNLGEWIEIQNVSGSPILLNDLVLKDDGADSHVITAANDLIVNPGQYFLLGRNADMLLNGGVDIGYEYATYSLSNSSDEVLLETTAGVVIDRVDYSGAMGFSRGVSMQLGNQHDFKAVDNNDAQYWCPATTTFGGGDFGTPGVVNSDCLPPAVVTIYDIQDATKPNHPAPNSDVEVKGVVVSAKSDRFIWVQEIAGGAHSGIHIQAGSTDVSLLNVGDTIDFIGAYIEASGQSQITLDSFTVSASGATTSPELLDSAIFADAVEAEKWEGVLVQINEAGVTKENADGPGNNFNETLLDGVIRIDDRLSAFTQPAPCSFFDTIVGPVEFSFGNYKILPRSTADMVESSETVTDSSADATASVSIVGVGAGGYSPKILCVSSGATLTFTNDSTGTHDAVSRNPAEVAPNNFSTNTLLPALLAPGSEFSFVAGAEATEHYRCTPHPTMEGVIIVLP